MEIRKYSMSLMRTRLCYLLLLALVFRALIPIGYMPNLKADGITVQICSNSQNKTIQLDADGKPVDPAHRQIQKLCDFSINTIFIEAGVGPVLVQHSVSESSGDLYVASYAPPALAVFSARAPPQLIFA